MSSSSSSSSSTSGSLNGTSTSNNTKSSEYGKPKVGPRVSAEQEQEITRPKGSDSSVEFHGMGVRGVGQPFERVAYNPRPLGEHDVQIKIHYAGICASDIHFVDGGWALGQQYPVIPGHEIAGIVTAAGPKATHKIGDRVGVGCQVMTCRQSSCKACSTERENLCEKMVLTYGAKYSDGLATFGGYSDYIRVHSDFVFNIPESIPLSEAASLFCAGVTTYAPIARHVKPGMNVGVIGIGGLGHLAIQFASKIGAHVTAISSSDSKREDAKKLGATDYINTSKPEDVGRGRRAFDVVINSVTSNSNDIQKDYDGWLSFVGIDGKFIMLGVPDDPAQFNLFGLIFPQLSFIGSCIGSPKEIREMLQFAAESGVRPWIQIKPLSEAGEAVQQVRQGKPRYRIVLDTSK